MSIKDNNPASTHNSDSPSKKLTKDIPYSMKLYQNATSSIASSIAIIVAALTLFNYSGKWIDKTTLRIDHQFAVAELNREMKDKQREHDAEIERLKRQASYKETLWQIKNVYTRSNPD